MRKCMFIFGTFTHGSAGNMFDEGISLLQMRVQPHRDVQEHETTAKAKVKTAGDAQATCPCTDGPSLTLKTPLHSNLGGSGPDVDSPEEILYPEAGVIDGQPVGVRIWTSDTYKGKSSKNGVVGSLGRLSMKTAQTVNFKLAVVNAAKENVPIGSLAMTFLDLDEGKKGKGRVSVTACHADQFALESTELVLSHDGDCSTATSSTKGTGADNPRSVEGGLADEVGSKRIVSYIFESSEDGVYSFTFDVSKGYGLRNFLFSLSPGAACISDGNMPQGCSEAIEKEALDLTTAAPSPEDEKGPAEPPTTPAPEEEEFHFVIANGQNACPEGSSGIADAAACEASAPSLKYEGQRNGRWENRGDNFNFMPPGCVLYTGWSSGPHEAIVLWNTNQNGINDGNRGVACAPFPAEEEPDAGAEELPEAGQEPIEYTIALGNACPAGTSAIADAAACEAAAPSLQYGSHRPGRWMNRGDNFGFMPPGCVLYTGWSSGPHEAIVLWNNNQNGVNDGNRGVACGPGSVEEEEALEAETPELFIEVGANTCPPGRSPISDAAACEAAAPLLKYGNQRHGRWENRGNNFGFMPPGCVLYTGWPSGNHEAIVLWNNNQNGQNDGNRAVVCQPGSVEEEEEAAEEAAPAESSEPFIGVGANTCPAGTSPIADAAACEAIAPSLKYANHPNGKWENRGNNFGFMPPGCVLYTGWPSGPHAGIVLWNNNQNGQNDGNRAIVCQSGSVEEEEAAPAEPPAPPFVGVGANTCPPGKSPIANAAACEALAPSINYAGRQPGRWQNRGNHFGFMPPGCVLYTGWASGPHESIVLWNNNENGNNDGNRAVICQ